jgi:hypothetical protein
LKWRRYVDGARVGAAWAAARPPRPNRRRQCWSGAARWPAFSDGVRVADLPATELVSSKLMERSAPLCQETAGLFDAGSLEKVVVKMAAPRRLALA